MGNKFNDASAIINVIGNIYNNPSLLDDDKYFFNEADFCEEFPRTIFGAIYNLHALGTQNVDINVIEDYLDSRPKAKALYEAYRGAEYIEQVSAASHLSTFPYYYNRMKKFTLLRSYDAVGVDVKWLYDPDNILDSKKVELQNAWLDNTDINDIADKVDYKILKVREKYINNRDADMVAAGDGIEDLIKDLEAKPDWGYPMYGPLINAVTRGARLGRLYLWSGGTGAGKTRNMIAHICNISCDKIYDLNAMEWKANGTKEPAMFIATEQDEAECRTMMLAFISGVNEEKIVYGGYEGDERDRVYEAAKILNNSPLYIRRIPDFSLSDIEMIIKTAIREKNIRYFAFDYIQSTMKILSEISSRAKVSNLREDNILFMLGVKLKDIAVDYNVFIMSGTQLSGDYKETIALDQTLLRGAKSLADKVDIGIIMLRTNEKDKEALKVICSRGFPMPDIKVSVYKNRRGRWKDIVLWCKSDLGTCRIEPLFATTYGYELVDIQDVQVRVSTKNVASAF